MTRIFSKYIFTLCHTYICVSNVSCLEYLDVRSVRNITVTRVKPRTSVFVRKDKKSYVLQYRAVTGLQTCHVIAKLKRILYVYTLYVHGVRVCCLFVCVCNSVRACVHARECTSTCVCVFENVCCITLV
jgi:hypothetical protein